MKNKIAALFLVLTMIFSMTVSAGASAITADATDAETLLTGLGILNADSYNPDEKITRGEFATLISLLLSYGEDKGGQTWYDNTFGKEVIDSGILPEEPLFSDVDASHSEYEGIKAVVNAGYMNGISSDRFAPDFQIALSEAVKVLVSMLGYDEIATALGGFPAGYNQVATKCKLYTGVNQSIDSALTRRNVVQLISNVLDVPVKALSEVNDGNIVYTDSGETFMNFYLGLYKAEGVMTDNGTTSLTAATSRVGASSMIVGGKTLKYSDRTYTYSSYIGRDVDAYYLVDKKGKNVCVYVEAVDDVTIITEGTSFSHGVLHYTIDGRNDSIPVPRSAAVIYNGVYSGNYTDAMLTVSDGDVTIIDGNNGLVLVVNKYQDFLVANVSYDSQKIYNLLTFPAGSLEKTSLSLKEGDQYRTVHVFDANGKKITVDDIKKGDVLSVLSSADNSTYLEVRIVPDSKKQFAYTSWTNNEIIGPDGSYEFGTSFINANNKNEFVSNNGVNIYVNAFNRIVWIGEEGREDISADASKLDGKTVGIYTDVGPDTPNSLDEEYFIRLYTQSGELKVYKIPEKITVDGARMVDSALDAYMDPFTGKPILFTAEEDVITSIVTPGEYGNEDNRNWYHVSPELNMFRTTPTGVAPFKIKYYQPGDGASFGANFAYDSNTKYVFTVPTDENMFDNEKRFFVNDGLSSGTSYYVEAYSTIKDDPVPEVLVIYENTEGSGQITRNRALLITKVVETEGEDGEKLTAFEGYRIMQNSLTKVTVPVATDAYMSKPKEDYSATVEPLSSTDINRAQYGPLTYAELEPGDIIRYGTDGDGHIKVIRIAFDYNQWKGFDDSGNHTAWASFAGPVYNVSKKGIKILTENVNPGSVTTEADFKKIKGYAFGGSKYPLVFVKNTGSKLYFSEGTYEDITSYEMSGSVSTCDFACILTHFSGGRMGGVVYVR